MSKHFIFGLFVGLISSGGIKIRLDNRNRDKEIWERLQKELDNDYEYMAQIGKQHPDKPVMAILNKHIDEINEDCKSLHNLPKAMCDDLKQKAQVKTAELNQLVNEQKQ